MLRCRNCTATFAFLQCGSHLYQKLRCSKRKTALQHRNRCVAGKWRFPAAFLRVSSPHVFRHPRFGLADTVSDRFSRGFREGISFPNFVERSILELPLSKLCAVPLALQNRALFERKKGRKGAEERGGRGVVSKGCKKEKGTRENRSVFLSEHKNGENRKTLTDIHGFGTNRVAPFLGCGTVHAVLVSGSDGSCGERGFLCIFKLW